MRRAPVRVAVVADLLEERWPSMDLVAETLTSQLEKLQGDAPIECELLRPTFGPGEGTADRYLRRYVDYPMWLRARRDLFDVFHIVDHSYAHLVHVLPSARTIVTCHDVDTFLPLVRPSLTTTRLPKTVVRILRAGMRKARFVTCDTEATQDEVREYDLIDPSRLIVVRNGTGDVFTPAPDPGADAALDRLAGHGDVAITAVHVGTTIPRKRIDVLLRAIAAVKDAGHRVRLLKAGGRFTTEQLQSIASLGLERDVVQLPFLEPGMLAALYRRATVVLMTSEREGFGLPVVEALACGAPVVATDIKVLREVGGRAARYCPLLDIDAWRDAIVGAAALRRSAGWQSGASAEGIAQAARFTWSAYARDMADVYRRVAA